MGNLIQLPNITFDSLVVEGQEKSAAKKTSIFDAKNYLNTRLSDGETEKTITIRLLPMDLETGNPFAIIHTHNVKVPQSMVKPGEKPFKTYICLNRTKDIDAEKFGRKCPFCEINKKAYEESTKTTDPVVKKNWQEISIANLPKESVITRCIERGKEDEGVKFWKFNIRSDKTDPYNQILKLVNLRKENAERKGKVENILDIYNGRDLTITFTEGSTSAPTIVDDMDRSPLSENEELMRQWIFDSKRWQDVFTCKPYEYLSLVAQMRTPWFDRANGVWVDKDEFEDKNKKKTEDIDSDINAAKNAVLNPNTEQTSGRESNNGTSDFVDSLMLKDDEDNMPF
jgi:hypothetical protein